MKLKTITLVLFLFINCLMSCEEKENLDAKKFQLLQGNWNSYESGTEASGFEKVITTSLTLRYESGLSFSNDGTFSPRYYSRDTGTWRTDEPAGRWELRGKTISLTFSPDTPDEFRLDLEVVRLDDNYLWFRHSYFGDELEHHLERGAE